jgi:hypothetical protein
MSLSYADIGSVTVHTTDYRGATPEELADRAVDRIIYVGGNSHPVIVQQAVAYKDSIRQLLVHYFREAQEAERNTICGKLMLQGHTDLSELIKKL